MADCSHFHCTRSDGVRVPLLPFGCLFGINSYCCLYSSILLLSAHNLASHNSAVVSRQLLFDGTGKYFYGHYSSDDSCGTVHVGTLKPDCTAHNNDLSCYLLPPSTIVSHANIQWRRFPSHSRRQRQFSQLYTGIYVNLSFGMLTVAWLVALVVVESILPSLEV